MITEFKIFENLDWGKKNVSGKKITPNRFVYHISDKKNRNDIYENGLQLKVGDSYKSWVRGSLKKENNKIIPAIFASNCDIKELGMTSGYDIWSIDTWKIENQWFEDKHFSFLPNNPHIVTFKNITSGLKLEFMG